eukprot:1148134-Karenia_brevis.AAC.1
MASGVRTEQSSGESVASPSEMVVYGGPVSRQPVVRPTTVMPFPMTNVTPLPLARGVIRPASR